MSLRTILFSALVATLAGFGSGQSDDIWVGCFSGANRENRCCEKYQSVPGANYTGINCSGASVASGSSYRYCMNPNPYVPGAIWGACCETAAPSNNTLAHGRSTGCTLMGQAQFQDWP
ncbi:hypothetical protein GGR57DRAFT_470385 [Xylariaceae sp. FL1272]|nr:hypothetical protein GGR57DRAFT_470385 [Xylariaceae sp. FL1272]